MGFPITLVLAVTAGVWLEMASCTAREAAAIIATLRYRKYCRLGKRLALTTTLPIDSPRTRDSAGSQKSLVIRISLSGNLKRVPRAYLKSRARSLAMTLVWTKPPDLKYVTPAM